MTVPPPPSAVSAGDSATLFRKSEVWLILGISLGQSAVYSVLSLIGKLTAPAPLSQQSARLNTSVTPDRPWLDLAYQLARILFALVPVLFAAHLLNRDPGPPRRKDGPLSGARRALGLVARLPGPDARSKGWGFDLGAGALLAAVIGIPGLGLYLAAKALGVNATVVPANLPDVWWAAPVLILAAVENAVLEEVIVVGYLITRMEQFELRRPAFLGAVPLLGRMSSQAWRLTAIIGASALLRGTYHLYQGFGAFVGNVVMGVVFALVFLRWRRVGPLIAAHTVLDVVAFVGFLLIADHVGWL
jgi:uncharacterized protein